MRGHPTRRMRRIRRLSSPRGQGAPGAPAPGVDPYIGTVLADRYRILRELGRGSMGTVYLGEHAALDKKLAVKVLAEEYAHLDEAVQRFIQEAKAASRIQHENIVAVTDFGRTPTGSVFLVMEYLEGRELAALLREGGALAADRVRRIGLQLCDALQTAHDQGIVHRDMKPENIIVMAHPGRPDFVKIVDFGIARINVLDRSAERLTCAGAVFGSPQYIPPEQARGEETDHRADIYSVGCILYEMLTGTLPFPGTTVAALLSQHLFEAPEPPRRRAPLHNIPPSLEAVVLRALEKDRDRRFPTMTAMAAALAAPGGAPAETAPPPGEALPRPVEATPHPSEFLLRQHAAPSRAPSRTSVAALMDDVQLAVEDGLMRVALALAERAVAEAGGIDAPALRDRLPLLERVFVPHCGDLGQSLDAVPARAQGLDAQTAFLLSRVDNWMTVQDVLDISGMARPVAAYRIAQLLRLGALVPHGASAAGPPRG